MLAERVEPREYFQGYFYEFIAPALLDAVDAQSGFD